MKDVLSVFIGREKTNKEERKRQRELEKEIELENIKRIREAFKQGDKDSTSGAGKLVSRNSDHIMIFDDDNKILSPLPRSQAFSSEENGEVLRWN